MTTITDLPVEIIDKFADDFAKVQDLCNARLTCRLFGNIFRHRVFKTIVLDFSDLKNVPRLIELANGPSDIHFYARTLKIRCLAPAGSGFVLQIRFEARGTWGYPQGSMQSDIHRALRTITRYLPNGLRHFHHLENVSWRTTGIDMNCMYAPIMDLLCSQENLYKIHIDMASDLRVPYPDFSRLSKLTEFSVVFPRRHIPSGPLFRGVAQALTNSPGLTSLRLEIQPNPTHPDLIEFDHVYESIRSLCNLEALSLIIPTITSLNEFAVFDNMARLTTLELHPTNHTNGWDEVWKYLRDRQIHLKVIAFNIVFMEMNFIDYLKSYSGAEELRLSNNEKLWVDDSIDRTALGIAFFEVVEEKHWDSILVLETSFHLKLDPWRSVKRSYANFPNLEIMSPM
ncbi:hypothetical protein Agabi119p4_6717 [Agaricus bisporus var. burnettii]|uniref:F-box domain-containing protein n=1 Tax=Agaricus bisporus var. burnettii TaxID=192524 RepID=A0A8H7CC01_AGABI|nr:hypothetical protein Agabi119p4_6717 [Agaricus bisporus var. burnettii]